MIALQILTGLRVLRARLSHTLQSQLCLWAGIRDGKTCTSGEVAAPSVELACGYPVCLFLRYRHALRVLKGTCWRRDPGETLRLRVQVLSSNPPPAPPPLGGLLLVTSGKPRGQLDPFGLSRVT